VNLFHDNRVDMRDDRMVVMGRLSAPGTGKYIYSVRAVTPGSFVVPPARGECMYDFGINSIGESGRLDVTPADSPRLANIEFENQGQ
jgi:uncharacterized protein YfaS (alpha-2-macroglobulin family)